MELDATLRKGFRLGDWEIRPIEGLVIGTKDSCHLQPKTMDVLVCLAASQGQVVTRDEVLTRVWGANAVSDEPLTRCIHEIRRALGDQCEEPAYIKTIPKRGYQLLARVSELPLEAYLPEAAEAPSDGVFWQVTRQRVLWVGAGYAVLAWLFVQLARYAEQRTSADLALPDWLMPLFVIIILLGFPAAIFYAWVKQISVDTKGNLAASAAPFPGIKALLYSRRGIDIVLITLVMAVLAGMAIDLSPSAAVVVNKTENYRIAVMPFETARDDGQNSWLGEGIAEDVHHRLAAYEGVGLSSRAHSFRASIRDLDVQQLGQELDVNYLLHGLVVRGPDVIWIKVRLTDSITGFDVWSKSYSQPATQLFEVEQAIALAVKDSLFPGATETPGSNDDWPAALNVDSYENYLRGRYELRAADNERSLMKAIAAFEHALLIDQRLGVARNGLCQAYLKEMELGVTDWDWAYAKANQACAEAILQSPDSVAAHLVLADFYRATGHAANAMDEYGWVANRQPGNHAAWVGLARAMWLNGAAQDAEDAFNIAFGIDSADPDGQEFYLAFLMAEGRYSEAVTAGRRLVRLDRDRFSAYAYLADALFMAGEFDAAIQASRQVLSRDLEHQSAIMTVARSYYFLGRHQRAGEIYQQAARMMPNNHLPIGGMASAYAQMDTSDSLETSRELFSTARNLAEKQLADDSADALTAAALAYYCAALDDAACANENFARAILLSPDDANVNYFAALVHAEQGDVQRASIAVQRAMELGYPQELVVTDPMLVDAWSQRRFAATEHKVQLLADY